MGRRAAERASLSDGTVIGYGFKIRNGIFQVQFKSKDGTKYVTLSTDVAVPQKYNSLKDKPPADAYTQAIRLIGRHHTPDPEVAPLRATWEVAIQHLIATPDLRPDSIRAYVTAINALRCYIVVRGPAEVTETHVHQFKREFLSGTFTKTNAAGGKQYKRSPVSCISYLRSLRSLWTKHFRPSGFVLSNPFTQVPYPNAPKGKQRVRMPSEDAVVALLAFMDATGWELPGLFTRVKMFAACRTIDLCRVKSIDLSGEVLTLSADVSKTKTSRAVPLPTELSTALHRVKGPTWLWERSFEEAKTHRPATRTRNQQEYRPQTWRWTMTNLFRQFNKPRTANDRVRPHDLRARGITLVAKATGSVDATAEILGVDPQTARHYLDRAQAFEDGGFLKKMAGILVPAPKTPES